MTCSTVTQWDPFTVVNVLFFLNVCVGFWVVGLLQRSFWLIDPYWSIIPPLIAHFYRLHTSTLAAVSARGDLMLILVWIWSIRLTHSYFRREEWKLGEREDWRYNKMATVDYPKSWPIMSFFFVGVCQWPMLVGISAWPLHYGYLGLDRRVSPLNLIDILATVLALVGVATAYFSDTQLYEYMSNNERLVRESKPKVPLLDTGLWRYSRHPNYFGEQLFWWSIGLFAVNVGAWWAVGGTLFNSVIMWVTTGMTEERILTGWDGERAKLFKRYVETTSMWVPMPPRRIKKD